MTEDVPVRSVARAIDILLTLAEGPQSLGVIAHRTELSKATVHRLLSSLGHGQLVMQDDETGQYLLGAGCFTLAGAVVRGFGRLGGVARPALEHLRSLTNETITIHVRGGIQRICIEELVSPQPLRYTAGIGAATPIHSGSAGKCLLAFMDDGQRQEILDQLEFEALTPETITDPERLVADLARIRRRGYAQSRGERVSGGAAISAPVLGPRGEVLAAISILGPESRLPERRLRQLSPLLMETAKRISDRVAKTSLPSTDREGATA